MIEPSEPQLAARSRADESDRMTHGQRRINLIWELTQALIALGVTATTLFVAETLVIRDGDLVGAFLLLSNAFFLVIGFYFGRTNHTRIGGIGPSGEAGR